MLKKVFVPAALAIGFVGSSQAQMTIYGLIDGSYGKSLQSEIFLRERADFHSGGDNSSSEGNSTTRIGIKGSTDVGQGIKANFRFETGGIESDGTVNGGGAFFNRQAWAGFSGNWGEVRLGRQDSIPFQVMTAFDFNGASNGVSAGAYSGVGVWARGRQSRSLQYISPTFSGVMGQVGIVPKGNRGPGAKAVLSGAAKYEAGPIAAGVSFQTKDSETTKDFASIAASYDLGFMKAMVGYADGGKFASGGSGNGPSVGINVPFAGFNFGAHYAQNMDDDVKVKSAEVWVNKEILKNTYAYVEAGNWRTSLAVNPFDALAKRSGTGYAAGVIWTF